MFVNPFFFAKQGQLCPKVATNLFEALSLNYLLFK